MFAYKFGNKYYIQSKAQCDVLQVWIDINWSIELIDFFFFISSWCHMKRQKIGEVIENHPDGGLNVCIKIHC